MSTATYVVEVTGTDTAITKLESVDRVVHSMANSVSGRFKQVAGDVGVVGDRLGSKLGETFARASSDATGLIETLSGGGLGLAIVGVTASLAGLEWAWRKMQESADRGISATFEALQKQDDAIKDLAKRIQGENRKATEDDRDSAAARLSAAVITYGQLVNSEEEFQKELTEKKRTASITYEQFEQAKADRVNAINLALTRRNQAQQDLEVIQRKMTAQKIVEAAEKADRDKEAASKKAEAERTANQKREANERVRLEEKEAKERMEMIRKVILAKSASTLEALHEGLDELDEAIAYGDSDLAKIDEDARKARAKALSDDVDEQLKKQRDGNDKAAESEKTRREEIERTTIALAKKAEADQMAAQETRVSASVNAAYGVTMMSVQPVVDSFTRQLQFLGTVNRENYKDLKAQVDDLPAIIAKEAQTIAAGIAMQATSKAIMEGAEALRETGTGFGMLAIGSPTSGLHFQAAAIHAASAAAYAALGGVAGGAAFGIGMSRGPGGLVGLTREEREAQDRDRKRGGSSVSSGPSSGRMGGRSDSSPVQVVFNYGVAVMDSRDEQRTANVVTMGVRRANRDGYARKAMGAS